MDLGTKDREKLEISCPYVSEDGDTIWLAISHTEAVRWTKTGWVKEVPPLDAKPEWGMPSGVIRMTWGSTYGCLDDLRERFFEPYKYRDLTKRPYNTSKGWDIEEGEVSESWLIFRLHKLAINVSHDV